MFRGNGVRMLRLNTALFMPASNTRAIAKARALACDAVILDLEDAVAPNAKTAARMQAIAAVREGFGDRLVIVRINGLGTAWIDEDLAELVDIACDAVLVPKIDEVDDLRWVRARLPSTPMWAMIESCRGVLNLPQIANAAGAIGLAALVAGTNDLAQDMRCRPDAARTPLLPSLTQVVVAARASGIAVLDGVYNALNDPDGLAAECRQGAMLGFDGKTLIHPGQIEAANAAFGPSDEAVAWARDVITAFADPANADRGAIRLGDAMIERLHLIEAERIVAASRPRSPN